MKKLIKKIVRLLLLNILWRRQKKSREREYKVIAKKNHLSLKKDDRCKLWEKKWSQFGYKITSTQFSVFSSYIGFNVNIVPEEVCHLFLEPYLNDVRYRSFYRDKNMFDRLLPNVRQPKTLLRKIGSFFYDADYTTLPNIRNVMDVLSKINDSRIFVKPSIDSCSGKGVLCFEKKDNIFKCVNNPIVTIDEYLKSGDNFIVQEGVSQSPFISQFNETSINTIRMVVYKSVVTNDCHIINAILRVGAKNSVVDNTHSGGVFVGIDKEGFLGKVALNRCGQRFFNINGINLNQNFKCPAWDKIKKFAKDIGNQLTHFRLIALDIALNDSDQPCLIEFNINTFSTLAIQLANGPAFGEFTDEILEYCLKQYKKERFLLNILY